MSSVLITKEPPFDCYSKVDHPLKGKYRPIGINRNNFVALTQLRPYAKKDRMALMWIAEGSNVFNAFVPFYANVTKTPDYLNHAGTVRRRKNSTGLIASSAPLPMPTMPARQVPLSATKRPLPPRLTP